jgi:release factor glutamine methyltransferase
VRVADALADAERALRDAGVPDPERDAQRLLRHALGWDAAALVSRSRELVAATALARFESLVAERSRRVPLQHLVGAVEFWRRDFLVSPAALIPRPETELLVERALRALPAGRAPVVVDVGTGTGCIALSIAAERPDARVHAVDVSGDALALARENARRLGLEGRVAFHEGDLLAPVASLAGQADLIASNPPYLDASEMDTLAVEVRDHEPRVALLPPDGNRYSIYRRLLPQACRWLRPDGLLLLEIGLGMEQKLRALCASAGLCVVEVLPDLQAIPRVVVARREAA